MSPWDLVVWSVAVGAGILVISGPVALLVLAISVGRGKL